MNSNNNDYEEDFEDEEEKVCTASYVVAAIDTHISMFVQQSNKQLPFRSCLEACLRILECLIFVTDKKHWNTFAVMLTRPVPVFIDFANNILDSITLLKCKLKLTDEELYVEFKQKEDFNLAHFFHECKKTFRYLSRDFSYKTLIYITNNDNPGSTIHEKYTSIVQAKWFKVSEITFEIISTDEKFNFSLFYNEMFVTINQDSENCEQFKEICLDVDELEQKFSSKLLPNSFKTEVAFYPYKNDKEKCLTCFEFKLQQIKEFYTWVRPEVTKVVKPKQSPVDYDNADTLSSFHAGTRNKKKIDVLQAFKKDSLYDVSYQKGYTLIYIGKAILDPIYSVGKPHILQQLPKEKLHYLHSFWRFCMDTENVMICVRKHKQSAPVKFCQMSPVIFGDVRTFLCKRIPFGNYLKPSYDVSLQPPTTDMGNLFKITSVINRDELKEHVIDDVAEINKTHGNYSTEKRKIPGELTMPRKRK